MHQQNHTLLPAKKCSPMLPYARMRIQEYSHAMIATTRGSDNIIFFAVVVDISSRRGFFVFGAFVAEPQRVQTMGIPNVKKLIVSSFPLLSVCESLPRKRPRRLKKAVSDGSAPHLNNCRGRE